MPRWLGKAIRRIRERAAAREVMFTLKARRELARLELELDEEDACDILAGLTAEDSAGRLNSAATGEWLYLFKPRLSDLFLYVKLAVRSNCVVTSFHEDADNSSEESE